MDNEQKTIEIDTTGYKTVDGGVTEEQIAAWRNQHGRVAEVEVVDPDFQEIHKGWFRRPDMKTMQMFSAMAKNNEIKGAEALFDNCWLGGSQLMKTDAVYKLQGLGALQNIFGKCVSSIKNL